MKPTICITFLVLGFLGLFSFIQKGHALQTKEPLWADTVKRIYPQWSQHYWVDRQLWGNRGYIVGGPFELRMRGLQVVSFGDDANLRGIPTEANWRKYTVKKGDCLWYIAGYPEIYGNPLKWPLIFQANQDQIQDPDLIYPGQVFMIPED